jgi:hypothetical protein
LSRNVNRAAKSAEISTESGLVLPEQRLPMIATPPAADWNGIYIAGSK